METMGPPGSTPSKARPFKCDFCDEHPSAYLMRDMRGDVWRACVVHRAELETTVDEVNQQEMAK